MKSHKLAHWLLDHGDYDLFLATDDAVYLVVAAHQGLVNDVNIPFIVLSSKDLSEQAPNAPTLLE